MDRASSSLHNLGLTEEGYEVFCKLRAVYSSANHKQIFAILGMEWKDGEDNTLSKNTTPLHIAARIGNIEAIKILLRLGCDVDSLDSWDRTPLYFAAEHGQVEAIIVLGDAGANINMPSMDGTPLHRASLTGSVDAMKELISRGADIHSTEQCYGCTPLHFAARSGKIEALTVLTDLGSPINSRSGNKSTPLHVAVQLGNTKIISKLVELGADVNARDDEDTTPLHIAAKEGNVEAIKTLVRLRAEVDLNTDLGETPLYMACDNGMVDAVKELITLGANANTKLEVCKITPLHTAAFIGNLEIIKTLLDSRADINAVDYFGVTPLTHAVTCDHEQAAIALIKYGADITIKEMEEVSVLEKLYDISWGKKAIYTWLACGGDIEKLSAAFREVHPKLKEDVAAAVKEELELLITSLPEGKQNALISAINTHATKVVDNGDSTVIKVPSLRTICIHKIMKDPQKVIDACASSDDASPQDAGTMKVAPVAARDVDLPQESMEVAAEGKSLALDDLGILGDTAE